jgi:F-type H+-transporting ATPase subunit b
MALVFALVLVMKNLFFEPLARAMETREARIERAANAWEDAQSQIRGAAKEVSLAVNAARGEGYSLLDQARTEAHATARAELDKSREETQRHIADAKKRLSEETARATRELDAQSNRLAASLASRILGRSIEDVA